MTRLPSPSIDLGRKPTLAAGVMLFALGTYLIWDATKRKGSELPWPLRLLVPV